MENYQTMQNFQLGFTTMTTKDVTNSKKDWDDFWYSSEDGFYFDANTGLSYQIDSDEFLSVSEYQKKIYDETTISDLESQADDPMGIGK